MKHWLKNCRECISSNQNLSFSRDVLKLVGGTAVAQAVSILASPLITRIYGPEAFGTAALFLSIVGIIGVVACLRYELAIMITKKEEEAANLLGLSILISVAMGILTLIVFWQVKEQLLLKLNAPQLGPYIWLIPPAVFLSGAFISLSYWNSRKKHFWRLSLARINASLSTNGTQVGAGLAGYATEGCLIIGGIIGSLISTFVLGWQILRDDHKVLFEKVNLNGMRKGLSRYKRFLIFDTWSALLNSLSSQLPILILSGYFTSAIIGYYALAYRVLALPISVIGSSVGEVFFQRASKARYEGSLGTLVEKVTEVLLLISIYPLFLIFLFGEEIFSIIFGMNWGEAGIYAGILAPWILIVFTTSPISTLFSILEQQSNSLLVNIILTIFRAGSLLLGGVLDNVYIGLALFSLVGCCANIIVLFWLMNKSGASIKNLVLSTVHSLRYCFPIFIISIFIKVLLFSPLYLLAYCIITAPIYYLIISKKVANAALPGEMKNIIK